MFAIMYRIPLDPLTHPIGSDMTVLKKIQTPIWEGEGSVQRFT